MLDAIKAVRAETLKLCEENGHCTLQEVSNLIEAYTKIDETRYLQFSAPRSNPIWGEFLRWQHFVPYGGEKTTVEIRYASHLDIPERRFIVAKELCHALDNTKGSHTASDDSVSDLITQLSLLSASTSFTAPLLAEKVAEFGAVELMIPLAIRKQLLVNGTFAAIGVDGMMTRFRMPSLYIEMAFREDYISIIEALLP
jgi:hypothetical protein